MIKEAENPEPRNQDTPQCSNSIGFSLLVISEIETIVKVHDDDDVHDVSAKPCKTGNY